MINDYSDLNKANCRQLPSRCEEMLLTIIAKIYLSDREVFNANMPEFK